MDTEMNPSKIDRHCAYCLKFLPADTVTVCEKCQRRAYCSKVCQMNDWKQENGSQGHENWCYVQSCEEDLDWEVKPVAGKGLGVIAKRFIPAKSRIMVDAVREHDHPGIMDLMPIDGTLDEKIALNELGTLKDISCICLRISRVNHDCDPNANHLYDEDRHVKILYAEKDIQPGEEIAIAYQILKDTRGYAVDPTSIEYSLEAKWGIICKENCICHDKSMAEIIQNHRKLDGEIRKLAYYVPDSGIDDAMQMVRTMLKMQEAIKVPILCKAFTLLDGFEIGMKKNSGTQEEAINYLRQAYEIQAAILHPETAKLKEWKSYIDNPNSYFERPIYTVGIGPYKNDGSTP